ncbi:hypothetical protein FO519_007508 [Halicephalobus sp. NKZ332]|nr:hypothetical protein FO519_007508 [Halicephalobus sp. NKZ332]
MKLNTIAKPVLGNVQGSFAYNSIRDRWPKIVTKIVDQLHRNFYPLSKEKGNECGKEVTGVISKISEMRYMMETNKPLVSFEGKSDWEKKWNDELNKMRKELGGDDKLTWYDAPWLFVECYLYSKLNEFITKTTHLLDYDIFAVEKNQAFLDSEKMVSALLVELKNWETDRNVDEKAVLKRLIQISLWGNKCDLSLSSGDPSQIQETLFNSLEELSSSILANDIEKAADFILKECKNKEFHVIFDNAGLEVVTDLALAEFLVERGLVKKVVFHGKAFPWYVSDVTAKDYQWVPETMEKSSNESLQYFGRKWKNRREFEVKFDSFWTTGHVYWDLKEEDPNLFEELRNAGLVLFKGDLNYRKLVGDREWPYGTDFKFAIQSFKEIPFLTLRTLKAETVAGLPEVSIEKIKNKFGEKDLSWMVSSDYAVAQLNLP